jgi:hypothetical protein
MLTSLTLWTNTSRGAGGGEGQTAADMLNLKYFSPVYLLEGAAGQLQRGRHCYTILLSENAI